MPNRSILAAKIPGSTGVPQTKTWPYSGGTFKKGAVMIISANIAAEAGANPVAAIIGNAMQPVDSNLGFGAANSPLQVTGRNTTISIYIANRQTIFSGTLTNNTDTLVLPVLADVGVNYGLRKGSTGVNTGIWTPDKTATAAIKVIDIDTSVTGNEFVYFKYLDAALAHP